MSRAEGFQDRLSTLMPHLSERQLRLAAALEAPTTDALVGSNYSESGQSLFILDEIEIES